MTAIGFVLAFTGWLTGSLFGGKYVTNTVDKFAASSLISGLLLMVAGLATWFWRWLP